MFSLDFKTFVFEILENERCNFKVRKDFEELFPFCLFKIKGTLRVFKTKVDLTKPGKMIHNINQILNTY